MIPYRLKHVPTGLYLDYKSRMYRLNLTGKIYTSGVNATNYGFAGNEIRAYLPKGYPDAPDFNHLGYSKYFNVEDFVKEEVTVTIQPIK